MLVVIVLVVYFLAAMPRIKLFAYRLAPQSRRARVILIGDEIFDKVGGYMLGNFLTSLIAGVGTYAGLLAFGLPYPLLMALMGLIGALVAMPAAAALRLVLHKVTFRRLDTS
jgi:predicted PurR-regulated permease PerM